MATTAKVGIAGLTGIAGITALTGVFSALLACQPCYRPIVVAIPEGATAEWAEEGGDFTACVGSVTQTSVECGPNGDPEGTFRIRVTSGEDVWEEEVEVVADGLSCEPNVQLYIGVEPPDTGDSDGDTDASDTDDTDAG